MSLDLPYFNVVVLLQNKKLPASVSSDEGEVSEEEEEESVSYSNGNGQDKPQNENESKNGYFNLKQSNKNSVAKVSQFFLWLTSNICC